MATSKFRPTEPPSQTSPEVREWLDRTLQDMSVLLDGAADYLDDSTIAHTDANETITGDWILPGDTVIDGITASNLVDKSASETITGDWQFNGAFTHDVTAGTEAATFNGVVRLGFDAGDDASLVSTLHPFQIGPSSGQNIRMDANEILSVDNGATAILALNPDGGDVTINSNTGGDVLSLRDGSKLNINDTGDNDTFQIRNGGTNTFFEIVAGSTTSYMFDDATHYQFRPDAAGAVNVSLGAGSPDHAIGLVTTASASDHLQLTLYTNDGTSNHRAGFYWDAANSILGISHTYSSGTLPDFEVRIGNAQKLLFDSTDQSWNFYNDAILRAWESTNTHAAGMVAADSANGDVFFGNTESGSNQGVFIVPHVIDSYAGGTDIARTGMVCYTTQLVTDDSTITIDFRGLDGGFMFMVANSTSNAETAEPGPLLYWSGTYMSEISTTTHSQWSFGSGSNPDVDGDTNVWRSADGVISIKNRRASSRYYSVYLFAGA